MDRLVNSPDAALRGLPLREDLRLHEAAPDRDGAPAWSIQDPVTNRFFRIGWLEFECLVRWPGDPDAIARDIAENTPLYADRELVEDFGRFLAQHQLVRPSDQALARLAAKAGGPGWLHWRWWLHHYLFIRIPLVRPERWLAALLPFVRPLCSGPGIAAIVLASLLGIVMVARQWDSFTHGVMDILSPSGILGFLIALAVSKTLHELGHAFVATHHGVRVAHMGVALVVLWPMLYTDTSESWKLRTPRQRLAISSAGIAVEMALAGLATLAWALLDDGPLRQAMLYLATTGWVLSLALNASPFMRFDGYFIASDLLDYPNLHERSGAIARAWLRRTLLGWDEPDPEPVTARQRRALVGFAVFTWVYRLVVFLGIAVAVYLMFFKVLGIFLFAVEVVWFIVRPLWSEITVWRQRWSEVRPGRRFVLWLLPAALLVALAVPWPTQVEASGVARAERQQLVFAPFAARVTRVAPGGAVGQGAPLAQFEAPDLAAREVRTDALVQALQQRLTGLVADERGMEQQKTATGRLQEQLAEAEAVLEETGRLQIAADFAGQWADVDPAVQPGTWVGTKTQLGVLLDPSSWVVDAYVEQREVERIVPGAHARFRLHQQWNSVDATVVSIDTTRTARLPHAMLAARYGGPIATQTEGQSATTPVEALYRVRLRLSQPLPQAREARGHVSIEAEAQSVLLRTLKRLAAVAVRESGF